MIQLHKQEEVKTIKDTVLDLDDSELKHIEEAMYYSSDYMLKNNIYSRAVIYKHIYEKIKNFNNA